MENKELNRMKKPKMAALLSSVIWGGGQFYNKQSAKASFFFMFQCVLIGIELLTGHYFTGIESFRDCGFFIRGFWGVITLGTETSILTEQGLTAGDHSVMLLIQGIISVLILSIFIAIWIINIRDAYQTAIEINKNGKISSVKWLKNTWENSFEYIMMIPAAIMLMLFILMPIIFSALVAFTNYDIHNMPPANLLEWVGLTNFTSLFSLGGTTSGRGNIWLYTFKNVFIWTLLFALILTIVPFFIGLLQAIILNNKRIKGKRFWRSILILPWAMPAIISQLNFQQIFNGQFGPLNRFLIERGILESPILWLSDPHNPWLPRMTILFIGIWLGFPYFMALTSGSMSSISKDIYEAAEVDGANASQQFWKITLPLVLATTAPLLIMSFAFNFNNFGMIYFLTGGGPMNPGFIHAGQTDILISWIFTLTMTERMYNMASVMSLIIFLVIGTLSAWNFARTKSFQEEG